MAVRKSTIKKRKDLKRIEKGQVHVHTTHNNTIVTVTDMNGNTIAWASSGVLGLKGARKETAFAATQVTERAMNEAKQNGIRKVEIYIKGTGQGRSHHSRRASRGCGHYHDKGRVPHTPQRMSSAKTQKAVIRR